MSQAWAKGRDQRSKVCWKVNVTGIGKGLRVKVMSMGKVRGQGHRLGEQSGVKVITGLKLCQGKINFANKLYQIHK